MKMKRNKKIKPFYASKKLKNKEYVKKVLFDCFCHNDMEAFKEVLKAYLELKTKSRIIKKAGMSKTTFYRVLSKKSNPTVKNISKILQAI